jgi:hypothetical protein
VFYRDPPVCTRVDGRALDANQLLTDEGMCRGEVKDNLSAGNQTTIRGPTEDAIAVYTSCMTRRGYRTAEPDHQDQGLSGKSLCLA